MMEKCRAKFRLDERAEFGWNKDSKRYVFNAVYADGLPENERFAKATPSGRIELMIDNPAAHEFFEIGKTYYLDFTKAE